MSIFILMIISSLTGFNVVLTSFDSVGYEIDTSDEKHTNYRSKVSFLSLCKSIFL